MKDAAAATTIAARPHPIRLALIVSSFWKGLLSCNHFCYTRGQKKGLRPFPLLLVDRAQDARDGRPGELLVHPSLDLAIDPGKDALDVPTHRAERVGLAPVQGDRLALRLDRPEDIQERDSLGGTMSRQPPPCPPLGLDDARPRGAGRAGGG